MGLYLGGGEFIHSATNGVQKSVLSATDPYGKWWWDRWVGARRVIPSHYGTFPLLSGTPAMLRNLMPSEIELVTPAPGETVSL